ncbi:MAG: alpha/beta hydrolase [Leptolyngbyaceae cyanobacterium bins.302]|nr:alpha/beta hydrolase [Leptolyngbyaceae cyanobacterium bins.302]
MLFVTNRVLREGPTPSNPDGSFALPRQVNFALKNNQAEQSVYFCRRNGANDYVEVGNRSFFSALKDSKAQQILLYLHGYSNLPEPAIFPTAERLQALFNQKANGQVVVVPIIWPCDDDRGAVKDYFDDQIAADASDVAFARMFEKFLKWREVNSTLENPCAKPINVLAHSMGNRVLRGAIARSIEYFQPQGFPLIFRNVFMSAADVSNNTLDFGQKGEYIAHSARNAIIYFAGDDLAMRASKVANSSITARRMGHTGPEQIAQVPRNVFALDCGDFNNIYENPVGHSYFTTDPQGNPGLLFDHMWECIRRGRVPMEPANARVTILRSRFWL